MLKAGVYALLALGIFALVFALLPQRPVASARTGATLRGVTLTLYPSRDPDAVWRFRAADVTSDPLKEETHLSGLSDGGRWVKGSGGRPRLDATLAAPDLTIDAQDNMMTRQARITLVQQCADIDLKGTKDQPVRVEQGTGFSAPLAQVDAPSLSGRITRLKMRFDFYLEESGEDSDFTGSLDPTETCENGKRVPLARALATGEPT